MLGIEDLESDEDKAERLARVEVNKATDAALDVLGSYPFDLRSIIYDAIWGWMERELKAVEEARVNSQRLKEAAKQFLESKGEPLRVESVELSSGAVHSYVTEGLKAVVKNTAEQREET